MLNIREDFDIARYAQGLAANAPDVLRVLNPDTFSNRHKPAGEPAYLGPLPSLFRPDLWPMVKTRGFQDQLKNEINFIISKYFPVSALDKISDPRVEDKWYRPGKGRMPNLPHADDTPVQNKDRVFKSDIFVLTASLFPTITYPSLSPQAHAEIMKEHYDKKTLSGLRGACKDFAQEGVPGHVMMFKADCLIHAAACNERSYEENYEFLSGILPNPNDISYVLSDDNHIRSVFVRAVLFLKPEFTRGVYEQGLNLDLIKSNTGVSP